MIGRDDDEGLVEDAFSFEMLDRGADGVVELEKLAERAVVVEHVHLVLGVSSVRRPRSVHVSCRRRRPPT